MSFIMTHFVMRAPPPDVPGEVHARSQFERLSIRPVSLSYEEMLERLKRIENGKQKNVPGWHERPEHLGSKRPKTQKILEDRSRTHTWVFMRGEEEIGFCIAVKRGFDKTLSEKFGVSSGNGTEIYKIGLYPEFTNQGYGQVFLPSVQLALFNGQTASEELGTKKLTPSELIYLNTRDTNVVDSRRFYENQGYRRVGEETWVDPHSDEELTHKLVPVDNRAYPETPTTVDRIKRPFRPLGGLKVGMA